MFTQLDIGSDPLAMRTDAELYSVMQRACLLPKEPTSNPSPNELKFSLDTEVGDDGQGIFSLVKTFGTYGFQGSNFSVGEKQLLALCRALVKNSQIIVLVSINCSLHLRSTNRLSRTKPRVA